MLKTFELFAGIGANSKALTNLGIEHELVGFSEFDKYASQSFCAIHGVDASLNYGDIRNIDTDKLPDFDLLTFGFPCQDISVAGKQKGIIEGETRSGLYFEALRIIKAKLPKYAICENVKNLVGKKFRTQFNQILTDLEQLGYKNYWKVLNAKDYGIPQNRERVFIVSIRGEHTPFDFPGGFDNGLRLKDMLEQEVDEKYYINSSKVEKLLSQLDYENKDKLCCDMTINQPKFKDIGNCIKARYDAGIVNQKSEGIGVVETVRIGGLFDGEVKRQAGAIWDKNYLSPTLKTPSGGYSEPMIMVKEATKQGYAIAQEGDSINIQFPNSETRRGRVGHEVAQTIETSCNQATMQNYRIRKLTPKECWRLMKFEDTDIQKCRDIGISSTQLYKQAGNSICVNVLEEIYKQLFKEG